MGERSSAAYGGQGEHRENPVELSTLHSIASRTMYVTYNCVYMYVCMCVTVCIAIACDLPQLKSNYTYITKFHTEMVIMVAQAII